MQSEDFDRSAGASDGLAGELAPGAEPLCEVPVARARLMRRLGAIGPGIDGLLAAARRSRQIAPHEDALRLAITELANNAVIHAMGPATASPIEITLWALPDGALAQIADRSPPLPEAVRRLLLEARPACPAPESLPEGGWGLFLVRASVDRVRLCRRGGWNEILLEIRRRRKGPSRGPVAGPLTAP